MKSIVRILLLSLLCVGAISPAVAQKKSSANGNNKQSSAKPYFYGVIEYGDKSSKGASAEAASTEKNEVDGLAIENVDASVATGYNPTTDLFLYSDAKYVSADQGSLRATMWGEDFMLNLYMREPASYAMAEMPVEKLYDDRDFEIRTVNAMMAKQDYAAAAEKMQSLYKRTDETKKLCNLTCVKYIVTFGSLSGRAIWVCEDYVMPHFMAPYWGMIYPVLEGDFFLPFEGLHRNHVIARKVTMGEEAAQRASAIKLPVDNISIDEMLSNIMMDPLRFTR